MNLAILDIDGTLTNTNTVDTECFLKALEDCFTLSGIETDWSLYTHATDAAILEEIFQKHLRRNPSTDETTRLQNSFLAHLQSAFEICPEMFSAVEGAGDSLSVLKGDPEWAYVVATGGWDLIATFKLAAADLSVKSPIISCHDGITRETILQKPLEASLVFYNVSRFSRMVSLGDGVWDVKAAKFLDLPFVGIGRGSRAERLAVLGVSHVLPDFANLEAVFKAMKESSPPY